MKLIKLIKRNPYILLYFLSGLVYVFMYVEPAQSQSVTQTQPSLYCETGLGIFHQVNAVIAIILGGVNTRNCQTANWLIVGAVLLTLIFFIAGFCLYEWPNWSSKRKASKSRSGS